MRRKIVAGNWKMHGSQASASALVRAVSAGAPSCADIDILVLPSFVHLQLARALLQDSPVVLGAQNLYMGGEGAFTGEISATMLADSGCEYVLVGHSERRHIFNESLALVAAKCQAALAANLQPILCLGETLAQREAGETEQIIQQQLASVIEHVRIADFRRIIIAYEPVWAIGTGLTASPSQAQAVHGFIREQLMQYDVEIAHQSRILYGGSVKAENAASLFEMPDIDGALVGGASLDAKSFLAICQAASVMC